MPSGDRGWLLARPYGSENGRTRDVQAGEEERRREANNRLALFCTATFNLIAARCV